MDSVSQAFIDHAFSGESLLYETLAHRIAEDSELLALASHVRRGQVPPVLFFGAVHYLLLKEPLHPLSDFYRSLTRQPKPAVDVFPVFRTFCLERADEIIELVSTRNVQTNEVGRCACLLPAFETVRRAGQGRPLTLVEVGSSAGLNLLWDSYAYDYGKAGLFGNKTCPVKIKSELRGGHRPLIPDTFPQVATRVGIDVSPVDLRDHDSVLWLRSLVWPEQLERARLLHEAIREARAHPPTVLKGDAVERLPRLLDSAEKDATLCVFHSLTLFQFPKEARERFVGAMIDHSLHRDVYRVSMEWFRGESHPTLQLFAYRGGRETKTRLANCHPHGKWLEWTHR